MNASTRPPPKQHPNPMARCRHVSVVASSICRSSCCGSVCGSSGSGGGAMPTAAFTFSHAVAISLLLLSEARFTEPSLRA